MRSGLRYGAWTALFVLLVCLATPALAQDAYRVVDIEIEGNRIATQSLILGVASIDKGALLSASNVQETIQRLYGLGIFSDVSVEAEPVSGGLKVYIMVKELPKLAGLEFDGNKKIEAKDLKEKLRLGVGGYISPYLISAKRQEILDEYSDKGYFQARVTPDLHYSDDSTEAVLTYKIDERSKVKVEQVILTGNVRVEANDIIKKMRNRKRGFLRSSDFAKDKYEEDLEKIIEEYHKKGYVDAHLISDSMTIDTATNRMTIFLEVYEGPLYYFGDVTFSGNEKMTTKPLDKAMKFDSWDEFNLEKYEESLYELYSVYQEIGHLHARIYDERTTRNDSIIDISYQISEGLPSHINLVKIVGNTRTKDKVIRREISSFPGQIFNRALLIRSVRDVMALNFFTNVEPVPINLPNGDVDLEFKVEEKQTAQISAGAGYNSQDKVVGQAGVGIPNFRGMGQNLSFNIEFGRNRNSLSVSFTEPWLFGRPTLLGTDIYSSNRRWYADYTEGRQGGSIRLGRRLRWPDNYFRVYASYRLERNRFHDFDESFVRANSYKDFELVDTLVTGDPSSVAWVTKDVTYGRYYEGSILSYEEKWNTASRLSFTITRDSRNLPEFATKGSVLEYTFSNTGSWLGGFWKYQKHMIKASKFIPLFWRFALAAKVQYGAINATNDSTILISDRFNPGGTAYDGIVRGYDDGVLTPDTLALADELRYWYDQDPSVLDDSVTLDTATSDSVYVQEYRTRVRGNYMLITNIELQMPIIDNQLYFIGFFDAGNSWLHIEDMKLKDLYSSVGMGFRLMVPGMGTLGFDFGYPLRQYRDQERGWKAHFQIGTTFR